MGKSGGAQQLRMGDRVQVTKLCYRHYLQGLIGTVTLVHDHAVDVALDSDPALQQRVLGSSFKRGQDQTQGPVGPKIPQARRQFQFHELEKLPPPPSAPC